MSAKLIKSNVRQIQKENRQSLIRVINETAYEVASIARQLVPVDTGFLKSTIALETYNGGLLLKVVVGAFYGGYVEFGTPTQSAQPFLRPAIASVESRMNRRLGQIQAGLGKASGTGQTRITRSL